MNCKLPLVIILGKGADPNSEIRELSRSLLFVDNIQTVSLGRGTEKRANSLLNQGMKYGLWIVL